MGFLWLMLRDYTAGLTPVVLILVKPQVLQLLPQGLVMPQVLQLLPQGLVKPRVLQLLPQGFVVVLGVLLKAPTQE